jgi:hypothetical protein
MLREARFISPFALGCNETRSRMASGATRTRAVLADDAERSRAADLAAKQLTAEEIERARMEHIRRQIAAAERATKRGLELLEQPSGDSKPAEGARLLMAGHNIASAVLGVPNANLNVAGVSGARPVNITVVLTRDEMSWRADAATRKFLEEHPEHPQYARGLKQLDENRAFDIANGLVNPDGEPFPER